MVSPVWRAKLCREGWSSQDRVKCLHLEKDSQRHFHSVINLVSGQKVALNGGINELIGTAQFAEMYGIDFVRLAIEDTILSHLTIDSYSEALGCVLPRVVERSLALFLANFEQFARTEGFMSMDEDAVGSLLDSDLLQASKEERVFEAAVRWMQVGQRGLERGSSLLRKIRFRLMERVYLESILPIHEGGSRDFHRMLRELVYEALENGLCKVKTEVLRVQNQVDWSYYLGSGHEVARRIRVGSDTFAVALYGGRVWSSDWNGRLRFWNAETLAEERTMEGHNRAVLALVAWGGSMVSGCADGGVKVWDGATGQCLGALEGGHVGGVNALLVRCMSHLLHSVLWLRCCSKARETL